MSKSEATTRGVRVTVRAVHVPERSDPENGEWFFAYTVVIANESDDTVQLISRHWIITDANGQEQEVRGPGVVGKQPVLRPNERFEYTSACPLGTAFGSMHGSYQMVTDRGDELDVTIAPFSLAAPYALH